MSNLITIFWLLDVMNFQFMEMFDTTYPLNGLFWFFALILTADYDSIERQNEYNRRNRW